MENAQVKFTDIIRKHLFEYIYSDDSVEDACHIKEILNTLDVIDEKFTDLDEEMREKRREMVKRGMEVKKLQSELDLLKQKEPA